MQGLSGTVRGGDGGGGTPHRGRSDGGGDDGLASPLQCSRPPPAARITSVVMSDEQTTN